MNGLTFLCLETAAASSPLHLEWWLRREFSAIRPSGKENISLKELKDFLIRVNCKVATNRLKELFQEITGGDLTRTELNFESFVAFYHSLTYDYQLFLKYFKDYSAGSEMITLKEFTQFLVREQEEGTANSTDEKSAANFMKHYLPSAGTIPTQQLTDNNNSSPIDCTTAGTGDPFFTVHEFLDFLFSKENDAWDPKNDHVNQDMNRPLTSYWIASSHNTYLTGDQFRSESSVDAYARCLRMGCRCIECEYSIEF